jgi:hypothetical protein
MVITDKSFDILRQWAGNAVSMVRPIERLREDSGRDRKEQCEFLGKQAGAGLDDWPPSRFANFLVLAPPGTRTCANMNSSAARKKTIQAALRLQALAGKERY